MVVKEKNQGHFPMPWQRLRVDSCVHSWFLLCLYLREWTMFSSSFYGMYVHCHWW